MSASLQRCTAWLAALAILFAALAPSAAHALAAARGGVIGAEICSASGIRQVVGPDGAPVKKGANLVAAHCPLCLNPDAGAGLPPAAPSVQAPRRDASQAPVTAIRTAQSTSVPEAATARGPPAH